MPRNGSGVYSLPQAPFVAGTVISSAAVNSDLNDIASALTASLPRDGQAGMTGQLKLPDGSASAPGLTFSNEATTGFSRPTTGALAVDIQGTQVGFFNAQGWLGFTQGSAPIGAVIDFAGVSSPPGFWLLCGGQAVSRTTYSALFAVIGTSYGVGDGSTTYNLPDCRGVVIAGINNMVTGDSGRLTSTYYGNNPDVLGAQGGLQSHTLLTSEIPSHVHGNTATVNDPGHFHGGIPQNVGNHFQGGVNPLFDTAGGNTSTAATGITVTVNNAAQGGSGAHTNNPAYYDSLENHLCRSITMPFNSAGVYTPASGALTAAPGALIQSAVWNAINTDYTAVLTLLGQQLYGSTLVTTSPYVPLATDTYLFVNGSGGPITINLPTAASRAGYPLAIKDASGAAQTGNITVNRNGSDTIEGLTTIKIAAAYGGFTLFPLSGVWYIRL